MKCEFGKAIIDFADHLVGNGQMSPREAKIKDLVDASAPASEKHLRSFLRLTNYISRCVPHYADKVAPLTELLKKDKHFEWKAEQEQSFSAIKEYLTTHPILSTADSNKRFYLCVDASNVAIGAALCQLSEDNCYHPISYYGKKLNDSHRNYNITDKEGISFNSSCTCV